MGSDVSIGEKWRTAWIGAQEIGQNRGKRATAAQKAQSGCGWYWGIQPDWEIQTSRFNNQSNSHSACFWKTWFQAHDLQVGGVRNQQLQQISGEGEEEEVKSFSCLGLTGRIWTGWPHRPHFWPFGRFFRLQYPKNCSRLCIHWSWCQAFL